MDFGIVEENANIINREAASLIEYYSKIASDLTNIQKILSSDKKSHLPDRIEDLLREYDKVIDSISSYYIDYADTISNYTENTKDNLDRLTYNLGQISEKISSSISSMKMEEWGGYKKWILQ